MKNVVVLIADGTPDYLNDVFDINGVELPSEPVIVTLDFDKSRPIGRASLKKVDNKVLADIELFHEQPEVELYPCVGGCILGRDVNSERGSLITKCKINEISMSISGNADNRIEKVKLEKK